MDYWIFGDWMIFFSIQYDTDGVEDSCCEAGSLLADQENTQFSIIWMRRRTIPNFLSLGWYIFSL